MKVGFLALLSVLTFLFPEVANAREYITLQQTNGRGEASDLAKPYDWGSAECVQSKTGLEIQLGEKDKDSSLRLSLAKRKPKAGKTDERNSLANYDGSLSFVDRYSTKWSIDSKILKKSGCEISFGEAVEEDLVGKNIRVQVYCKALVPQDSTSGGNTNFEINDMYPITCKVTR